MHVSDQAPYVAWSRQNGSYLDIDSLAGVELTRASSFVLYSLSTVLIIVLQIHRM